jgi:3-isopropylmalate dehydratase small subunit
MLSPGVSHLFEEGDEVEVDIEKGELKNPRTKQTSSFEPLSGTPLRILTEGGIIPILKKSPSSRQGKKQGRAILLWTLRQAKQVVLPWSAGGRNST